MHINPNKHPISTFCRTQKVDPKTYIKMQATSNNKNNFEKNNKVGRLKLPDWKTYYYKATELRQGCFGKKITCKSMEQNKTRNGLNIIG